MTARATQSPRSDDTFRRARRFVRESAVQVLYQLDIAGDWDLEGFDFERYWEQVDSLAEGCPPEHDAAGLKREVVELVHGATAHRQDIDARLGASAKNWSLARMAVIDRNVLRLGAYEILYCDDVPPLAALDEAIEIAREFGDRNSTRFVNGILDRILRDKLAPPAAEGEAPAAASAGEGENAP